MRRGSRAPRERECTAVRQGRNIVSLKPEHTTRRCVTSRTFGRLIHPNFCRTGKANFRSWSASQIVPDRGRHVAGSARSWQARGRSGYHSTARLRVARETVARLADPGVASARWPSVEDRARHVPDCAKSCQAVQHPSYTTDARAQVARWVTSMTTQHVNVLHSRTACASAGGRETKPRRQSREVDQDTCWQHTW